MPISLFEDYFETPNKSAPSTDFCKYLDAILEGFESHLILEEYRRVIAPLSWAYVDDYTAWFYKVSYTIMTLDGLGKTPRLIIQEVFVARIDHVEDVSEVYQHVIKMGRSSIKARVFEDDNLFWPS